jgi:hypothetical protein
MPMDAALLQTSVLDGWVVSEESDPTTMEDREEFRRFLVDAHKAAYIPACIAAINTGTILTAEPTVVQPTTLDEIDEAVKSSPPVSPRGTTCDNMDENSEVAEEPKSWQGPMDCHRGDDHGQFGALMRRTKSSFVFPSSDSSSPTHSREKLVASPSSENRFQSIRVSNLGSIREDEDGIQEYFFVDQTQSKEE